MNEIEGGGDGEEKTGIQREAEKWKEGRIKEATEEEEEEDEAKEKDVGYRQKEEKRKRDKETERERDNESYDINTLASNSFKVNVKSNAPPKYSVFASASCSSIPANFGEDLGVVECFESA